MNKGADKKVVEIDVDSGGYHDHTYDIGWRLTAILILLILLVYGMFREYLTFSSQFVESYW